MLLVQLASISDFYCMWQLENIVFMQVYRYSKIFLQPPWYFEKSDFKEVCILSQLSPQ